MDPSELGRRLTRGENGTLRTRTEINMKRIWNLENKDGNKHEEKMRSWITRT